MTTDMKRPAEYLKLLQGKCKPEWKIAFLTTLIIGLMVHLPIFICDIPNHDGLASMHFDQNMITSGRWFLTIACGFSSYYTLPWLIGLLSLLWLALTAVLLVDFLEIKSNGVAVLVAGLLVSFPALASTYAYVFTADGYMLGLFLAVLAVYLTWKTKKGFLAGAICLAFSMGTYQAYLPFCILLCIYGVIVIELNTESFIEKVKSILRYIYMGILGGGLYFLILQVLLKIQGKELDTYQGINEMTSLGGDSLIASILKTYQDFLSFILKGNIVANNIISIGAVLLLVSMIGIVFIRLIFQRRLWKSVWFYLTIIILIIFVPICCNIILLVSPNVGYHLLMRYQYVLLLILGVAFVYKYGELEVGAEKCRKDSMLIWLEWIVGISCGILIINYGISDNVGYSNLQKRYEKTYAYCIRLADRMEQTEGYYTGMPVAMIGVVGDDNFPSTDITGNITGSMIGLAGDYLLYTGENYKAFFQHYLGITIEVVEQETVGEIYNTSEIYQSMDSFPGRNSMKVVDGVLYVKTENLEKQINVKE